MSFTPPRLPGLLLGGLFLTLLLAGAALAAGQLARSAISVWIVVWVALPLLCLPLGALVAYRLYGLLTASYRLDRDGFYLSWGLAREQIPLAELQPPRRVRELPGRWLPSGGLWWPGCAVGRGQVDGVGSVEFFATTPAEGQVLLSAGERHLAISPPDPAAFLQAFTEALRLGSLEPIPSISQRPNFLFNRLWSDWPARLMVMLGLAISLLLLAYLAVRAPTLPAQVPFGFDAAGNPDPWAPPGRLLLLPFIGGLCWLADLVIGAWLYRREGDRPLAYVVWATAGFVGLLLWGAALQLLAVAGRASP
ncbi:MAG: PH domain-containing protein [Chloroflexota bacterium]